MRAKDRATHLEQSLKLVPLAEDIRVRMIVEALRAHANAALEAVAANIDYTGDLAGEAGDHRAEDILRGVAENVRALQEPDATEEE